MDADTVLARVFDAVALETASVSGALTVLHKHTVLDVCGAAVLQRAPTDEDMKTLKAGEAVQYSSELPFRAPVKNLDIYFIDNMIKQPFFSAEHLGLPDQSFVYVPVSCADAYGICAFSCDKSSMTLRHVSSAEGGDNTALLNTVPIKLYKLRKSILDLIQDSGVAWSSLRPSFAVTAVAKAVILVLCGESSLLYILPQVFNRDSFGECYRNVVIKDNIYMLDGWNQSSMSFSTITHKGGIMSKGLLNPTKVRSGLVAAAVDNEPAVPEEVETKVDTPVEAPAATAEAAPVAEAHVQEAPVKEGSTKDAASTQDTEATTKKRRRKTAAKQVDFTDVDKIIEEVTKTVCDGADETKVKIDKLLYLQSRVVSLIVDEAQKCAINVGVAEEKLRLIHSILGA